jgi:hypothetical protein
MNAGQALVRFMRSFVPLGFIGGYLLPLISSGLLTQLNTSCLIGDLLQVKIFSIKHD